MLLSTLKSWSPFRIDALGLVTILGFHEINLSVGRFLHSWITECLPFLGAFTVASNQILEPIPGFVLYNISDGIMATDLSSWFTRWLTLYPLTYTSTVLEFKTDANPLPHPRWLASPSLGICVCSPLIVLACLMGDWWGLANALSMTASVIVRKVILLQNRAAIDRAVLLSTSPSLPQDEVVKAFLTTPSGKAVTIYAPRRIVINVLLTNTTPLNPALYSATRMTGWASFAIHIVALGMTSLFNQLLSVAVLAVSTILAIRGVGDMPHLLGERLYIDVSCRSANEFRAAAYAALNLSEKEEQSMVLWNLFPHRSNTRWWERYRAAIDERSGGNKQWASWDKILAGTVTHSSLESESETRTGNDGLGAPVEKEQYGGEQG
ncbi:uncharacterized protein Z518_00055 [Rhinocladiella mackenziei CBS 650.93]|uniref:Rhinocladiella mackenziei CBS 650.93 unplaced genomic scaffold supercont1.1, whole genome shotgun sequence n=1 Tax=Rhinocladiella mackenziei CBS 650.93 TaxID=1442369 RepID=A0A0D2G357_9EURO|nr:uncharacterized protein Z518_00055 [Rhinocladiella mackenziei CBS 650.93]KIX08977.1 hypothetical protein Z518_00055 [Rhinocladiella mackenziei CBS 650.93]